MQIEREYMREVEDEPERRWIIPPKAIAILTVIFFVVYAVGGVLIEIASWVLGAVFFVLFCLAMFAFLRWLFMERC